MWFPAGPHDEDGWIRAESIRLDSHMSVCGLHSIVWYVFVHGFRCKFLPEFAPKPKPKNSQHLFQNSTAAVV